ncbi:MAG: NUDIX hydrolase [Gemmatimonadales bacterium]|nr:MAG: NUDIX hydrolase [Gemmatimonadales bacterium]
MTHVAPPDGPGRLHRQPVHKGRIVDLSIDTVRFPDGSTGELEFIRHRGASAVLPLLGAPEDADPVVLLVRQYRYAAGGYVYEVPAGMPDRNGEPWEDCARRELEEETGQRAGSLQYLTRIFTTPGFTDEVIRLYLAWDLEAGNRQLDHDEFVEVVRVPFSQAVEWVRDGTIVDCKSIATILYAAQFVLGGPA